MYLLSRYKPQFFFLIVLFLFQTSSLLGQSASKVEDLNKLMFSSKVDSLLATMSDDEKIAQLFWLPVFVPGAPVETETITRLVTDYQPGGLIYFRNDPEKMLLLNNKLQGLSKIPLTVSIDGEWGLGMRLNNTISFPYQMTLGAIKNDTLIYQMGQEVARQFKRMGIHVNFAPVVDVNVDPENPVISYRSFGENPMLVARRASLYMKGMQDGGIMAVAKHFPGHGDTNTDSHKSLPLINKSRERLDSVELYPFRELIKEGVLGVMSGHLEVPALDSITKRPASISKPILTDFLKGELGFKGVIITDAMNMNGVKLTGKPGKVDALALIAGNDIIEFTEDLPKAISEVHLALDSGLITMQDIDLKVRKALALKDLLEVDKNRYGVVNELNQELNNSKANQVNYRLFQSAMTVLGSDSSLIPVQIDSLKKVPIVFIGEDQGFVQSASLRSGVQVYHLDYKASSQEVSKVSKQIKKSDRVVLVLASVKNLSSAKKARKTQRVANFVAHLCEKKGTTLLFFGNPYQLESVKNYSEVNSILLAYQDGGVVQQVATDALFGDFGCSGRLPVSIGKAYKYGDGVTVMDGIQFVSIPVKEFTDSDFPVIKSTEVIGELVIPEYLKQPLAVADSVSSSNQTMIENSISEDKSKNEVKADKLFNRIWSKMVLKYDSLRSRKDTLRAGKIPPLVNPTDSVSVDKSLTSGVETEQEVEILR